MAKRQKPMTMAEKEKKARKALNKWKAFPDVMKIQKSIEEANKHIPPKAFKGGMSPRFLIRKAKLDALENKVERGTATVEDLLSLFKEGLSISGGFESKGSLRKWQNNKAKKKLADVPAEDRDALVAKMTLLATNKEEIKLLRRISKLD